MYALPAARFGVVFESCQQPPADPKFHREMKQAVSLLLLQTKTLPTCSLQKLHTHEESFFFIFFGETAMVIDDSSGEAKTKTKTFIFLRTTNSVTSAGYI